MARLELYVIKIAKTVESNFQGCLAQTETKFPDNSMTDFQISLTMTYRLAVSHRLNQTILKT